MSTCKTCGREEDGHWLGCEKASDEGPMDPAAILGVYVADGQCTYDGCTEPRRSADKRVKFCEEHSDPKNRK